jgi:hypothetical protein
MQGGISSGLRPKRVKVPGTIRSRNFVPLPDHRLQGDRATTLGRNMDKRITLYTILSATFLTGLILAEIASPSTTER